MRRFSQRNYMVTLSDINITPLLDLAFVLLIIFVITTPLLDNTMDVTLPKGGKPDKRELEKEDIRTVEVNAKGEYRLNGQRMSLRQIEAELVRAQHARPNLTVDLRGDEGVGWGKVAAIWDICDRNGITRFAARTAPPR